MPTAFLAGAPPGAWAAVGFIAGAVGATVLWLAVLPLQGRRTVPPDNEQETPRRRP